jgi:cell filamentation protein
MMRKKGAEMNKISIRFFNDKEVRAVWDDTNSKWWFSVVDIIGVLTDSKDPRKYWTVLKTRLKQNNPQLATKCSQLKLTAKDGKKYATDCFNARQYYNACQNVPSKKTRNLLSGSYTATIRLTGKAKVRRMRFLIANYSE